MRADRSRIFTSGEKTPVTGAGKRGWRVAFLAILVGFAALVSGPAASAAPVGEDLRDVPAELQKYVPRSEAFANSPWMTSPTCKGKGGDFSIWASNVISDTPKLLAYFQASSFGAQAKPEDQARGQAMLAGYRDLARRIGGSVPASYCVDDLTRWAGPNPAMTPFGFPWGVTGKDGHQSVYFCTDRAPDAQRNTEYNRYFGAERAMCDGFYVACVHAQNTDDQNRCATWNAFSDRYVRQVEQLRGDAIDQHPATAKAAFETRTEWGGLLAAAGVLVAAGVLLLVIRRRVTRLQRSNGGGDDVRRT
jgi:hypothetical protein